MYKKCKPKVAVALLRNIVKNWERINKTENAIVLIRKEAIQAKDTRIVTKKQKKRAVVQETASLPGCTWK